MRLFSTLCLLLLAALAIGQFADSSGFNVQPTVTTTAAPGPGVGGGIPGGSSTTVISSNPFKDLNIFFRDGQNQDLQGIWAFGTDGFFVPPSDFAGVIGLANGTIIPTATVGTFCFDGFGGCAAEVTAVIGGNLGSQVFNVSFNRIRLVTQQCRYRVSRLGRVIVTASFTEVSSRFMTRRSLNPPIFIFIQLSSNSFGFVEIDQLFVLEGEIVRIQRFNALFDNSNSWGPSNGPAASGPAGNNNNFNNGPGINSNTGPVGNVNGNINNGNNNNGRFVNVCPALLRDDLLDNARSSDGFDPTSGGGWGSGFDV